MEDLIFAKLDATTHLYATVLVIFYTVVLALAAALGARMTILKRKNKERMRANIAKKMSSDIVLDAKDVIRIGRGFRLPPRSSRDVIFELHADVNDASSFAALKGLVAEIEREEPFDELPDEVKPSLSRISQLIEQSPESADKHVLLPVTKTLAKYVELKAEHEKTKRLAYLASAITIIGFVVGSISFYFTLKSPSEADIKKAIEQVFSDRASNVPIAK